MDQLSTEAKLELEKNYVKSTYDNIADTFSGTRYKKWPKVEAFIRSRSSGSLLLDVGCGNGKYLDNSSTVNIGCDVSTNLLSICKKRGFEVVLCDMMKLPFREQVFDTIICVASLHHIVATDRRRECAKKMVNLMYGHSSRLLIQVWAYEQEIDKNNPYLKSKQVSSSDIQHSTSEMCLHESVRLPVHKNRTPFTNQDLLVPFNSKQSSQDFLKSDRCETNKQYLRYYHVFKANELDALIEKIPEAEIVESYYDKGNWCTITKKSGGTT